MHQQGFGAARPVFSPMLQSSVTVVLRNVLALDGIPSGGLPPSIPVPLEHPLLVLMTTTIQ
ncbi:hypothetical protein KBY75_11545, partial [Cyanobium sp. T1G-Tous]|uniref:hypothetical protein n=1 Tax=Cyanobium sp. T1G-Tous TaxID=2823722 RepID=UPI0020CEE09C